MISNNIKSRIEKLLTHRDGALEIGSLHEAENASQRILEMLIKYNLELDDIKGEKAQPYELREIDIS